MVIPPAAPAPAPISGTVLRSFYYAGKPIPVGSKCKLPRVFALEMAAANKFAPEQAPAAPAVAQEKSPSEPERRNEKPASDKKGAK